MGDTPRGSHDQHGQAHKYCADGHGGRGKGILMLQALGGSLVMAIGITITPLAITASLLLLTTPRARLNGPAFLLGWLIGLSIVGIVVLAIFGPTHAGHRGAPATWLSWLRLALGLLLLAVPWYWLRHRPHPTEQRPRMPAFIEKVDKVRPGGALGIGALLSGARPKNVLLIVAGVAAISQVGLSAGGEGLAYVVFAVIATIGVAVPVVMFFTMGERAPDALASLEHWVSSHGAVITATVCVIIGVDLIGNSIAALVH